MDYLEEPTDEKNHLSNLNSLGNDVSGPTTI